MCVVTTRCLHLYVMAVLSGARVVRARPMRVCGGSMLVGGLMEYWGCNRVCLAVAKSDG